MEKYEKNITIYNKNNNEKKVIMYYDLEYKQIFKRIKEINIEILKLNSLIIDDSKIIQEAFSNIIGKKVDETFRIILPFYTDYGLNIDIGKNVFINHACTLMSIGGITIQDNVLIGPKVNIITADHLIDPDKRDSIIASPILIKKNAWIGTNSTILRGITIGNNSVIAAGSVVNCDVPDNCVFGGVPAKFIKHL